MTLCGFPTFVRQLIARAREGIVRRGRGGGGGSLLTALRSCMLGRAVWACRAWYDNLVKSHLNGSSDFLSSSPGAPTGGSSSSSSTTSPSVVVVDVLGERRAAKHFAAKKRFFTICIARDSLRTGLLNWRHAFCAASRRFAVARGCISARSVAATRAEDEPAA